jgi:hypothetical protein
MWKRNTGNSVHFLLNTTFFLMSDCEKEVNEENVN